MNQNFEKQVSWWYAGGAVAGLMITVVTPPEHIQIGLSGMFIAAIGYFSWLAWSNNRKV